MAVRFTFDFDKFLACLEYFASKQVPELDKYKAAKMLFLADKYHVVRYSRPITGDQYCALPHGPIPSEGLNLINAFIRMGDTSSDIQIQRMSEALNLNRNFQHPRFEARTSPAFEALSKSDVMALDAAIQRFGRKGFGELKSITHALYEYNAALEREPGRNNPEMNYEDFFEEDADAIEGALEEMIENAEIRDAFPAIESI